MGGKRAPSVTLRLCRSGTREREERTLVGRPRLGVLVLGPEDHAESDLLRLLRAVPADRSESREQVSTEAQDGRDQ